MVHKGSVAIEGISLTIADFNGEEITIAILPLTYGPHKPTCARSRCARQRRSRRARQTGRHAGAAGEKALI